MFFMTCRVAGFHQTSNHFFLNSCGMAVKWFHKSAESGSNDGQAEVGRIYEFGQGGSTNLSEAVLWYGKAAAHRNVAAKYRLVRLFQEGLIPGDSEVSNYLAAIEGNNVQTLNEFASSLATTETPEFRDGETAQRLAQKAVAATQRTNADYLDTLAAAYAETGKFENAIQVQTEATALVVDPRLRSNFAARLKHYQAHRAN
jgi:tetratricopeptide (TPR) repeat protein